MLESVTGDYGLIFSSRFTKNYSVKLTLSIVIIVKSTDLDGE